MLHFHVADVIENVCESFFVYIILSLYFGMLVTLASIFVIVFQFEPAYGLHHTTYGKAYSTWFNSTFVLVRDSFQLGLYGTVIPVN